MWQQENLFNKLMKKQTFSVIRNSFLSDLMNTFFSPEIFSWTFLSKNIKNLFNHANYL